MMEVGPWRVDGEGGLKTVQGGWEEYTTMVYGESLALTSYAHGHLSLCLSGSTCWNRSLVHQHEPLCTQPARGTC